MPDTLLSTLQTLAHSVPRQTLRGRNYYYLHFTDERSEAWTVGNLLQSPKWWWNWDSKPASLAPQSMSLATPPGCFFCFILICTYFDPPLSTMQQLACSGVVNVNPLALFQRAGSSDNPRNRSQAPSTAHKPCLPCCLFVLTVVSWWQRKVWTRTSVDFRIISHNFCSSQSWLLNSLGFEERTGLPHGLPFLGLRVLPDLGRGF